MKKVLTASTLVAAILITLSAFRKEAISYNEDMATVYVYRVGQFGGAAANWSIWVDGQKICKLSNNKFIKQEVKPGKHTISAKIGGTSILKKETQIEIDTEAGKSNFIACNVKQSFTRSRLEMIEVTKSTGERQMAKMTLDKCQEKIDKKEGQ